MASDIEIIVGARDDATRVLQYVASQTQSVGKAVDSITTKLTTSALKLAAGWLSVKAAAAAFHAAKDFLLLGAADYDRAVEAERALAIAIGLSGEASETSMGKHIALADSLEKQMNIEAEVILGLMKQASLMGVAERDLDNVAKAAIGLSHAMGIDLEGGLEKVRLASEGNFKSFEKLFPKIKEMTTNEEKMAAVMQLATKGLVSQSAAADTATGSVERANIAWGNMQEATGGALTGLRQLRNDGVVAIANAMTTILVPAVDAFTVSLGDLDSVGDSVQMLAKELVIGATFVETTLGNMSSIWNTTFATMELGLVSFANDVKFYLTEQIPSNFRNMLDGFKAMATDAAGYLKAAVTGGAYTPVAQNVGSSALPPRATTEREAALMKEIAQGITGVTGEFMGKAISRILEFERLSVQNAKQLKENTTIPGLIPPFKKDDDDPLGLKKNRLRDVPTLQATESRLLTRGTGGDPSLLVQKQILAKLTEQIVIDKDISYSLKKGKITRVEVVK